MTVFKFAAKGIISFFGIIFLVMLGAVTSIVAIFKLIELAFI